MGQKFTLIMSLDLTKNKEYEFQLLAFSLAGDGPKSSLKVTGTMDNGKD